MTQRDAWGSRGAGPSRGTLTVEAHTDSNWSLLAEAAGKLAMQGQWSEAADLNRRIVEEAVGDVGAYNRMGRALEALGRTAGARKRTRRRWPSTLIIRSPRAAWVAWQPRPGQRHRHRAGGTVRSHPGKAHRPRPARDAGGGTARAPGRVRSLRCVQELLGIGRVPARSGGAPAGSPPPASAAPRRSRSSRARLEVLVAADLHGQPQDAERVAPPAACRLTSEARQVEAVDDRRGPARRFQFQHRPDRDDVYDAAVTPVPVLEPGSNSRGMATAMCTARAIVRLGEYAAPGARAGSPRRSRRARGRRRRSCQGRSPRKPR